MKVEKLRGENNIKAAQVRAAASAAAASARSAAAADKSAVQFLDRDEQTVVRLNPAQESLLYEKGREMGIIPEDGTPTKNRHTRVKRYRSSSLGSSNRHRKPRYYVPSTSS